VFVCGVTRGYKEFKRDFEVSVFSLFSNGSSREKLVGGI